MNLPAGGHEICPVWFWVDIGRSSGSRGSPVGCGGDHGLVDEVRNRDRRVAGWACAADADSAGEGVAVLAALFAEQSFAAVGAFVDGDLPAGLGGRDGDDGTGLLVSAAERGLAAGGAAVGLPAGRDEAGRADGAAGRPGVVP